MTQIGAQAVTVVDFGTCPSPGRTVFHQLDAPAMYGVDHDLHVILSNTGRVAVPLAGWQVFFEAPERGGIVAFTCDPAMQLAPGQDRVVALGHRWGSSQVPVPFGLDPSECDPSQLDPIHRGVRSLPGAVALFDPRARAYGVTVMDGGGRQDIEALMSMVEAHHPGAMLQAPPRFLYSFDALVARRLAQGAFPKGSWAHDLPGGTQGYVYDPADDPAPTDAAFDPDVVGPAAGGLTPQGDGRSRPVLHGQGGTLQPTGDARSDVLGRTLTSASPEEAEGSLVWSEQQAAHPHMPLHITYRCQGLEGWAERVLTETALEQIVLHMGDLGPDRWPAKAAERTKQVAEPYLRQILSQAEPFQWQRGGNSGQMQGGFGLRAQDGTTHQFVLHDACATPKPALRPATKPALQDTARQSAVSQSAVPQTPVPHAAGSSDRTGAKASLSAAPRWLPSEAEPPAVQHLPDEAASPHQPFATRPSEPLQEVTEDLRCPIRNGRMTYRFIPPADSTTPARALPRPVLEAVLDWFMAHPASVWEQFPTPVVQTDLQVALLGTPVKSAQTEVLGSLIGRVDDGVFSVMAGDGGAHHFSVSARALGVQ